ncbi:alpha/beta-hydrolase [Parachaetomium inaequale]|uniref:Alpha/beta-hydrolase n=1 Tax=Parachaetomium inaequale TaxID=2588326 RepID=A0AAN6P5R7_9PEZI|nr:alpha/beta-hydrolase [Parachaetomium inaequale]
MAQRAEFIALRSGIKINVLVSQPPVQPSKLPTIILLHFWGGSASTWSLVNPLISQTYSTIALDFRGWGASTGPEEKGAYSIAALADDVEEVIVALQIKSFVLAGLSMGAKVAQLVAARVCSGLGNSGEAAVLQGLVLVSPAPPTPLALPPDMREQQLHAYDSQDSAEFVAKNILTRAFQSRDLPSFVVSDMLRGNVWAREAWPTYAMAEDVSGGISSITVPILVLAAAEDVVEPQERVKTEVCSRFPAVRFEVVPGSGHLSPLDTPETVAGHLLEFLDTLGPEV